MKKFLIIQTAFIGDVILATSLIEKLHKFYPDAEIDFLLRKGNEELLANHPYLNHVFVWDKKNRKYKNFIQIIKSIRQKKYDYVINCHRFTSSGLITILSRAKHKTGFDKNPFSLMFSKTYQHDIEGGIHEIERNNMLIQDITNDIPAKPKLYPSENDFKSVEQYKQSPYICIAPMSVRFTKQLPAVKWVELVDKIGEKIYLIGAPDDYNACQEIIDASTNKNIINLAGKLKLLQTAALIKDAKMNYVNDSAPLHIASAMNSPTTAIFCSTIPEFGFGPLADNSKIVDSRLDLKCRPCGIHGYNSCPEKHFECATSIDINDLI